MDKYNFYIQSWAEQINKIKTDTERMLINRYFLKEYFNIVRGNNQIQKPRDFHDWVTGNYYCSIVMNIRRQLDIRNDSISLLKLLKEIETTPEALSRYWYKTTHNYDWADADFTNNAGSGLFIDKKILTKDIKELKNLGHRIEKFGDEYFAHSSKQPTTSKLTLKEVDNFIDQFESVLKRYYLLFTGSGYTTFLPVWQYDWQKIFEYSWIENKK